MTEPRPRILLADDETAITSNLAPFLERGGFSVTVTGYARMIERLMALADELCGGKLVFTLEGGYSLQALGHSMVATLQVMMGLPYKDELGSKSPAVSEPNLDVLLKRVKAAHELG